jgi:hypothetical protein
MTVTTFPVDAELARIASLLDRLDPRADEPCRVPGCAHTTGSACGGVPDHVPHELAA